MLNLSQTMADEDARTLWCGNISEHVTEEILYELFLQAGPLEKVRIPRQKNFAFVTYTHEVSVPYAIELFRGTALFNRTLTLQRRTKSTLDQNNQPEHQSKQTHHSNHDNRTMKRHEESRQERSYKRSHPYRRDDYRRNDLAPRSNSNRNSGWVRR